MCIYCRGELVTIPGCFSSPDWNRGQIVSDAGTSSILTPSAGGGAPIAPSCGMMRVTGLTASRRLSSVLNNRDLCRIVSSYIPEPPTPEYLEEEEAKEEEGEHDE